MEREDSFNKKISSRFRGGGRDRNEGLKRTFTYALLKLMHLSLAKKNSQEENANARKQMENNVHRDVYNANVCIGARGE